MTYAESIAVEHMAYRRRHGYSWDDVATEAAECLQAVGVPCLTLRYPAQIERAFATAYARMRRPDQ